MKRMMMGLLVAFTLGGCSASPDTHDGVEAHAKAGGVMPKQAIDRMDQATLFCNDQAGGVTAACLGRYGAGASFQVNIDYCNQVGDDYFANCMSGLGY